MNTRLGDLIRQIAKDFGIPEARLWQLIQPPSPSAAPLYGTLTVTFGAFTPQREPFNPPQKAKPQPFVHEDPDPSIAEILDDVLTPQE